MISIIWCSKNAWQKNKYTGILALQLIKQIRNMVRNLSFLEWMDLVDKIAGTLQPNPINKGKKLLPDNPIAFNGASIKTEILASIPLSSNNPKKKNNKRIIGINLNIANTPDKIPFIINEYKYSLRFNWIKNIDNKYWILFNIKSNIWNKYCPILPKVNIKIINNKINKQG